MGKVFRASHRPAAPAAHWKLTRVTRAGWIDQARFLVYNSHIHMGSAPFPSKNERDRIEEDLMREVEQARAAYEEAKAQSATLMECSTELGPDHPDGRTAARKATTMQSAATERYAKALKAFANFVLGKPLP